MTMVEQVARAIIASKLFQPAYGPWREDVMTATQQCAMDAARAAIAAMREPTAEMLNASGEFNKQRAADTHRAMIDAALSTGRPHDNLSTDPRRWSLDKLARERRNGFAAVIAEWERRTGGEL